jgi:hypothetical protein
MKVDVIYDQGGDWAVLYVNGQAKFQGHSIRDDDWKILLKELGVEVNDYQEADFSSSGYAPDYLEEVEIIYG